jgi:ABC-2 type transport system permease protein
MFELLKKELSSFFSSITGYVVIIVFLLINSLFIWVFPSEFNILDNGYASLDSLFFLSPWVFLFLVPAVSMRLFSEEKNSGTIELLYTKPLTELEIVFAKYFAGLSLVLFSILPSLIYFLSVYLLGETQGNLDTGGTWGSYIGLFFLAAIYVSIGVMSSAITNNQVIAFLLAVFISFIFYIGFDFISSLSVFTEINTLVLKIGINEHYKSMSRGVLDSRDVVYFLGVIGIFLSITKTIISSKNY